MNFKDMQKNLETEINNISKEDGVAEEKNQKNIEQEFTQVKQEIKKLHMTTARIVKLEKDFELLDSVDGNGKDEELEQMPTSLMKAITKNQEDIKKKVVQKKKDDEIKAKAAAELEEKAETIQSTFTPDLGFNWEDQGTIKI